MKIKNNDKKNCVAIDLALIPDKKAWEKLILLNKALGLNERSFSFDLGHRPHITLWQDFVLPDEIAGLIKELSGEALDIPKEVEFVGLNGLGTLAPGYYTPCLEFSPSHSSTQHIFRLHQLAIEVFKFHGAQGRVKQGNFAGDNIHERCHHYVQQYGSEKSGANFYPHLTLGVGPDIEAINKLAASMAWPWRVGIDSLVLAQLGDVCTVSSQIFWEKKI